MCGRFTLTSTPEALAERFGLDAAPSVAPRFNIAPGQDVLAIRARRDGSRGADLLRWGLVPSWSDPASSSSLLFNARAETAAQRPAFRDAFRARRCIVPASGFYEWAAAEVSGSHTGSRPTTGRRSASQGSGSAGSHPMAQRSSRSSN